jgi:hypothetical protein
MNNTQAAWPAILNALEKATDPHLRELLDSSALAYDGAYCVSAGAEVYVDLCRYYPVIETVVQDLTGSHLRLSLTPSSVPMGTDLSPLDVFSGASNLTDAIISPESIAAVPSYLLRFVPYVGSAAVLIATALRQAFYRASRDHGADQLFPKNGDSVSIHVEGLLDMLGHSISRAKFFRLFKDGSLDWFVRRAEPAHQVSAGRVRRLPNTYHYRGQVLTPGDAQDLYSWLLRENLAADPAGVLARAQQTARSQILTFPYRLPREGDLPEFAAAPSVQDVVKTALAAQRLSPQLAAACDKLSAHLIRPESFLAVPWYWFHNVLPALGDDLGMLWLMSKSCCYIDWARGRDRDTFWVPGGLSTLQGWVRSETLPRRIPHAVPSNRGRRPQVEISAASRYTREWREDTRDLAGQYLCRLAVRPSSQGMDWQLRVADVRLTHPDEILRDALYGFLYQPPAPISAETLAHFTHDSAFQNLLIAASRAHPQRLCHFETLANEGFCQNETLDPALIRHFDMLVDGLNYYFETLVSSGLCQFDTVIKILYRIRNSSLISEITTFPPDMGPVAQSTDGLPTVVGNFDNSGWDYAALLRRVNPLLRQKVLERKLGPAFLSWLIYASLIPSVHHPLSLAVTRVLESGLGAGANAERLAQLPAEKLAGLLQVLCTRLEGGYLGPLALPEEGGPDLLALLEGAESAALRLQLARRLADALGLRSASAG